MLSAGDKAPGFELENQFGEVTSLSDYAGKWVVVWWIPSTMADMTPACCDTVAKGFAAAIAEHPELNVVGLSFDTPDLMRQFATRGSVLFPLLADEDKAVGDAYGVRRGGDWDCFPKKVAFLVTPEGYIEKVYPNIDPDFFVDEIIHDLDARNVVEDDKPSLFRRLIGR